MKNGLSILISTSILIFLTILLINHPVNLYADAEDITPPELIDFSFTPMTTDVTAGTQSVTFTAHVTDDFLGTGSVHVFCRSPSGSQTVAGSTSAPIAGTIYDGIYEVTLSFPQYSETGTWQVSPLLLIDNIDNRRHIYPAELSLMGLPFELEVTLPTDTDGDGVEDSVDNCPTISNANQADLDSDGLGDVCDECELDSDNDIDEDGVCGDVDNCPTAYNDDQMDLDRDGQGDVCDNDADSDGFDWTVDCNDLDSSINPNACDIKRDGIDQDCDYQDRTKGKPCVSDDPDDPVVTREKDCSDESDNDGDGLIDCDDPDCSKKKSCR